MDRSIDNKGEICLGCNYCGKNRLVEEMEETPRGYYCTEECKLQGERDGRRRERLRQRHYAVSNRFYF